MAEELSNSKDSGRQVRKDAAFVMLPKKLKHEILEKFCVRLPSKGWGKGVGSPGGLEGMVGTGALAVVVGDGLTLDAEVDVEVANASCRGSRTPCRSCGVQLRTCEANFSHGTVPGASVKISNAIGCTRYRVEAVMRTRKNGTSITNHLVLRPIRRFTSTAGKPLWVPASRTGVCGLSSLILGRGDGGGVNIAAAVRVSLLWD